MLPRRFITRFVAICSSCYTSYFHVSIYPLFPLSFHLDRGGSVSRSAEAARQGSQPCAIGSNAGYGTIRWRRMLDGLFRPTCTYNPPSGAIEPGNVFDLLYSVPMSRYVGYVLRRELSLPRPRPCLPCASRSQLLRELRMTQGDRKQLQLSC